MGATALTGSTGPTLRIRGTDYPVLLPTIRDPRLHLAGVIVTLQVLGQVAFEFRLSIAQILVSLLTCAVLEVAIAFRRRRVLMWPASALLTGNGVAFILRVPGTEHGDWWSMRGWWIFAGTSAVALLSKHVVRYRGRHVFNPSNFGLVLCFLVLSESLAEPLDFWWGPMSPWLALALALIVAGGFAILRRLRLVGVAVGFWLAFAAGIGLLVATGHEMTARWHLGPITGTELWRVLVFSPEILVFLFFMITDPKTVPEGRNARRAFGVAIGLLAVLLIAPQTTEYATKVAVLGALALACAARPALELLRSRGVLDGLAARAGLGGGSVGRVPVAALAATGAAAFAGLVVVAGLPARPSAEVAAASPAGATGIREIDIVHSAGVATRLDDRTARTIVAAARGGLDGPSQVERARVGLEPGFRQGPPVAVATLAGTREGARFERTFELELVDGSFVVVGEREEQAGAPASPDRVASPPVLPSPEGLVAPGLRDVAAEVGLDFRHGSFRFAVTPGDPVAMMGGGLCWLDYDGDGWLDLFVVNSYSERDIARWKREGGLPRSSLFRNEQGRFVDVGRRSGADLDLRGSGCVAADLDLDGHTDLIVTSSTYSALLWNEGNGTFTEGARAAGIDEYGWRTGAAVGDLDGDGLPDLVLAGYTNLNAPVPGSFAGFPTSHEGVRDLVYLNDGPGEGGRPRFREVGAVAGLAADEPAHGLGVVVSDLDRDGRLDVYVANDGDPNRLFLNVPLPGGAAADPSGLGFRLEEVAEREGVADANAGMGIAVADADGDGRLDLFVSNSREQGHAVYHARSTGPLFEDVRADLAPAFGRHFTGWGASWLDLDHDTRLDLVLANGAIPIASLAEDAEPIQVLRQGRSAAFADAGARFAADERLRLNGRGLAAADFDNDGDLDIAVNQIGGPLVLLENTVATGSWLGVTLAGFHPGARVTAVLPDGRTLVREVRAGGSYLSSEDQRVHFGLGEARRVREVRVDWPGGGSTVARNVPAGERIELGAAPSAAATIVGAEKGSSRERSAR